MSVFEQTIGELRAKVNTLEGEQERSRDDRRELFKLVRDIHGDVRAMKERQESLENVESDISDLKNWRNIVVGGSIVAWLVFAASCAAAWDWAKAHMIVSLK